MSKRIVIVESPTKAKTINKFLGAGYVVRSSMGHVRDLPHNKLAVDVDKDFEPEYKIMPKRKEMVKSLKAEVKATDEVYLAPDHDREGEAIAWHLCKALDIPEGKAHRVIFNEITKEAIKKAFEHPVEIDMDKVNAQQARRILDRLV
ncbi:MAG: toprim domain-containing protein, partial [Planctomycetes bacterium]|nr:toprim domain-containing protein [Planctomycetota bacterium]